MSPTRLYIAGTREHAGKTTCSLAIISGLLKRRQRVGYLKPVGQRFQNIGGLYVDQDAALMKEYFMMHYDARAMAPVAVPPGYTRDYIDGRITEQQQIDAILHACNRVAEGNDTVVIEGTGHTGVGSIINMNNARVAQLLGADMILVANGGLGSAFDELELNHTMCKEYGVNIRGIILNKVRPDKLQMVEHYFSKLLHRWGVPLLACIPDEQFLGQATLLQLERLLGGELITGKRDGLRHYPFDRAQVVVTDLRRFNSTLEESDPRTLFLTHCSRDDIILGFIAHCHKLRAKEEHPEAALVLCGHHTEDFYRSVQDTVTAHDFPILTAPHTTQHALRLLQNFVPKFTFTDTVRVKAAIQHYEPFIAFENLGAK